MKEDNIAFILSFLAVHNAGVICTTDSNNDAYGSVIYFKTDENLNITFTTKDKTKKSQNIKNNSKVMLVVFDVEKQTTLQILGIAEEITDQQQSEEALTMTLSASLKATGNTIAPVAKLNAGEFVAYRIKTTSIRMASYSDAEVTDYNERFITVEI